jgi:cytochrome c-type biogenesis protein CcmH
MSARAIRGFVLAALAVFGARVAVVPAFADPTLPQAVEDRNGPAHLADPKLEARAVALQKQLRCLVCQGESLDESNAQLAKDLRRLIRKKILEGSSNAAIKSYLVSRYGDFILMKPPLRIETYALWFGPLVVFLIAAGVAGFVVVRARSRARAATP